MNNRNSGLGAGTIGAPQETLENTEAERIAAENEEALYESVLISELETNGIKFNRADMVFITRDKTGQIIWLENGDKSGGLIHILDGNGTKEGHAKDFERAFGIKRSDVPSFLKEVLTNGEIISSEIKRVKNRLGYERIYSYKGKHFLLAGIGTNGYVVSAYPIGD